MNDLYITWRTSLYIAVVLCIVIGQLHADKCDYTQFTDNSIMCQQITESVFDSYLHVEPTRFIFLRFYEPCLLFSAWNR